MQILKQLVIYIISWVPPMEKSFLQVICRVTAHHRGSYLDFNLNSIFSLDFTLMIPSPCGIVAHLLLFLNQQQFEFSDIAYNDDLDTRLDPQIIARYTIINIYLSTQEKIRMGVIMEQYSTACAFRVAKEMLKRTNLEHSSSR